MPRASKKNPNARQDMPALDPRLQSACNGTSDLVREVLKQNTLRNYDRTKKLYLEWCDIKKFPLGYTFIWNHELFNTEEWKGHERYAIEMAQDRSNQYDQRLDQCMPAFMEYCKTRDDHHGQVLAQILSKMTNLETENRQLRAELAANTSGTRCIQEALTRPIVLPAMLQRPQSSSAGETGSGTVSDSHASIGGGGTTNSSTQLDQSGNSTTSNDVFLSPFAMDRGVKTVSLLWQEYTVGLQGRPPVKEKYESTDQTWRKSNDGERKFYNRRVPIYNHIKIQAGLSGRSESDEAAKLETFRKTTLKNISLQDLGVYLAKQAKAVQAQNGA